MVDVYKYVTLSSLRAMGTAHPQQSTQYNASKTITLPTIAMKSLLAAVPLLAGLSTAAINDLCQASGVSRHGVSSFERAMANLPSSRETVSGHLPDHHVVWKPRRQPACRRGLPQRPQQRQVLSFPEVQLEPWDLHGDGQWAVSHQLCCVRLARCHISSRPVRLANYNVLPCSNQCPGPSSYRCCLSP